MFQQRRWLSKSHISLFTGQNFVSSNISVLTYLILLWTDRQVITTSVMDHQECPGESRRRNLLLNRMEKRTNSDGMCSVKMTNLWSSLKSTRWQSSHIKSVCGSAWMSCVLCYPQGHTEALWRDVFHWVLMLWDNALIKTEIPRGTNVTDNQKSQKGNKHRYFSFTSFCGHLLWRTPDL